MWMGNSVTSVRDSVTSAHSGQCRYFSVTSKECYAPRLRMTDDSYMCGQTNEHPQGFPYECNPYMLYRFLRKIHRYVYQFLHSKINPFMYGFFSEIRRYMYQFLSSSRKLPVEPTFHFCSMERNVNPPYNHDNLIHI